MRGGCEDGGVWSDLRAERVARELAGLAARELVTAELLCAVDGLVDQVVPADASCWSTFDPATTMLTSAVGRNLDEDGDDAVRFMELEYVTQAPGHYRGLMSSGDPLIVQDAVAARPASDEHAQVGEHLAAMGLGQELRIVLRHQRTGWGGAGLMRRTGAAPFDDDEQRFLRHVAPSITAAIRASLVRSIAEPVAIDPDRQGPAVVVVEGAEVMEATPAAQRWLEQLGAADRGHGPMPAVLAAVAVAAANGRTVAQRARTADGTWLVVRSAPLGWPPGHRHDRRGRPARCRRDPQRRARVVGTRDRRGGRSAPWLVHQGDRHRPPPVDLHRPGSPQDGLPARPVSTAGESSSPTCSSASTRRGWADPSAPTASSPTLPNRPLRTPDTRVGHHRRRRMDRAPATCRPRTSDRARDGVPRRRARCARTAH